VQCAAAVWGPWDVVARVKTTNVNQLLKFIDQLRKGNNDIDRTETWWIRRDQPRRELPGLPDRLAFVMLRVGPRADVTNAIEEVFATSNDDARVWHVAGVLGSYDIATMIGYEDDAALTQLVMNRLQTLHGIIDTLTIPTIAGMVYPEGRPKRHRLAGDFGTDFEKKFPRAAHEVSLASKAYAANLPRCMRRLSDDSCGIRPQGYCLIARNT
jgi:DNA-binding Lrp family transcriptional regulator